MATMPFVIPRSWRHVLVLLCCITPMCTVLPVCRAQLQFTLTRPQDINPNGQFSTWTSIVANSLLPPGSNGVFVGTVPADTVEYACHLVESGRFSIQATVTVGGQQEDYTLQLQATGGCDASDASPEGVEFVVRDIESGNTFAVVCDESTQSLGCQLYVTGDQVDSYVEGALQAQGEGGARGRMPQKRDPDCFFIGSISGIIIGTPVAAINCPAFGPLATLCFGGVILVSVTISMRSCNTVLAGATCFPGDSMVIIESGQKKLMSELTIGDKVGVWGANGAIHFDNVYAFGHADADSIGLFINVTLESLDEYFPHACFRSLVLSPGHFIPTVIGKGRTLYKRAQDLQLGSKMWATTCNNHGVSMFQVTRINLIHKKGLYNPFTLGGTIIVDGVVASTHSDWFLDNIFNAMGISHWLPHAYQVVLSPAQTLYKITSKNAYHYLYVYLDKKVNIPNFGTKYAGIISLAMGVTSIAIGGMLIRGFTMRVKSC